MQVLAARLKDKQQQEQHDKEAAQRKSLVGSGDRSERIRTYNYPQGRVTDHRINLTLYKLGNIMEGDLRSEEHTSELQSLMRISYAVFCLKKKKHKKLENTHTVNNITTTTTH